MLILCHLNKKSCCLKEHSLCQISFGLFTFRSDRLILEKVFYFLEGWRHSSVDSSLPTILRSRVRIPSTPYTLLCNQILCYICHCSEKMRIISKNRPGFVYSLKSFFNPMPQTTIGSQCGLYVWPVRRPKKKMPNYFVFANLSFLSYQIFCSKSTQVSVIFFKIRLFCLSL